MLPRNLPVRSLYPPPLPHLGSCTGLPIGSPGSTMISTAIPIWLPVLRGKVSQRSTRPTRPAQAPPGLASNFPSKTPIPLKLPRCPAHSGHMRPRGSAVAETLCPTRSSPWIPRDASHPPFGSVASPGSSALL